MTLEFLKKKVISLTWEKVQCMNETKGKAKVTKPQHEFLGLIMSKSQEIQTGQVPQEVACQGFLKMFNDKTLTLPWQRVQSILAGEMSKKKRVRQNWK